MNPKDFVWTEKYRPATIEDCILPKRIKDEVRPYVEMGKVPNMIFYGSPGCGKTTLALAMCKELGADSMFINASDESGIDVLRTKIRQFASTVSFGGGQKIVILDESDHMQAGSTQPAMRGFLEEFAGHCSFIFTANYKNRIIEPLLSRLVEVDFNIAESELNEMRKGIAKASIGILDKEGIKYSKDSVILVIKKFFPDFRKIVSTLQRYSVSGEIDSGILSTLDDTKILELIGYVKDKNFTDVRRWVANNSSLNASQFYRDLYKALLEEIEQSSIPQMILHLGDYQYRATNAVDHEINNMCCLISIMRDCKFKA